MDQVDPNGAWLEIGLDRGEGSTKFFVENSKIRNVKFYGVDADHVQVENARKNLEQNASLPSNVEIYHARGEDFLNKFAQTSPNQKFSLVYLDNFDWDYWCNQKEKKWVTQQKQHYRDYMQIEMTNLNSQTTHLVQAMRLMPMMTERSIIVCDDTWFEPNEGVFIGKCSAVIPFLLINGYKILNSEGYRNDSGVILGRL